jgi:hypothetical protein
MNYFLSIPFSSHKLIVETTFLLPDPVSPNFRYDRRQSMAFYHPQSGKIMAGKNVIGMIRELSMGI